MAILSWRHHALIQALLSRGPLAQLDFTAIFSQVTGKPYDANQQLFNDFLRKINAELGYVQFELRACRNQYDGNVYYGIVNNVSDDQSKLGTKYTVPQIAFYKGIVEAIIQDPEAQGSISNIDALNIRLETQVPCAADPQSQAASTQVPAAFKNFSMTQKEKTLEQLVKDQWLCSTPDGKIGLGIRSLLDLRSWFRSNEVPACEVCNEAAIKAQPCKNDGCGIRIHQYCLKKKFSQKRGEKVCPGCGTQWSGLSVKAEALEAEVEEDVKPNVSSLKKKAHPEPSSSRKRNRLSQMVNDETVSTLSEERVTRRSSRLRVR